MIFQNTANAQMAGITDDVPDWLNSAKDLVTAYNQQQILEANIQRQAQGLPPIDTSQIAPTYNIGLSPEVKSMLILGGLALLAILLLKGGKKS